MKSLIVVAFVAVAVFAQEETEKEAPARPVPPPPPAGAEKQEFQTDVRKMLDIIINSLYTNRNIFLRELISNSADAIDKIRFLYLTKPKEPVNDGGVAPTMDIRISADKEMRTLRIRDGGVGMTKTDLVNNLGRIGSSGTKQFVEKFQQGGGDMSLIGQFGVGFYSAFLAADRVVVASKSDDETKQWVWDSSADGEYTLYEDPRGNTLGRGTEITLYLKEDADEFLETNRLRDIAARYSEFIHFPIFLEKAQDEKKKDDVKATDEDADAAEKEGDDDAADDTKKVAAKYSGEPKAKHEWARLNENKPIWTRSPDDVGDDEYKKFYRVLTKDYDDPLVWDHFTAEGEVEFKSIIYIPSVAPARLFEGAATVVSSIKLYVRRVFITDEFKDMLPRYLSFIAGVVDSDDLPLNVSRELLQESRILKIIKKKLIKKVLGLIKDVAEHDQRALDEYNEKVSAAEDADAKEKVEKPEMKYEKLWKEYGKALRLGLIDDAANRARLSKFLRYKTTKTTGDKRGEWRSLEQYVDSMLPEQGEIYFIVGLDETVEALDKKPFIQRFKRVGAEVLLMTDPIDEYVVGHMTEFAGKKLVNLAKEDVKVPGEDSEASRKLAERRKKANSDFLEWYKGVLGTRVERVVLSDRLVDAPAIVVSSKYGLTAAMHQIMKGTALGQQQAHAPLQKILEINLNHPVVRSLRDKMRAAGADDEPLKDDALLLFETALFESGFQLDDPKEFIQRMQVSLGKKLGVEAFETLADEELPPEEVAKDDEADVDADADEEDEPAAAKKGAAAEEDSVSAEEL